MNSTPFCTTALSVIETEAAAIAGLADRIDQSFEQACGMLLHCQGRVIVLGMGKSGHIGNKIAATFASTGTPAFFVHPAEAGHGDMGMITRHDIALAISNSGETQELITLLPLIKRIGIQLIAMTGKATSTLAQAADVHIDVHVDKEACPLDLAPTASTTAALVMGDALAMALLSARGFSADDFAFSHPVGTLGRRLLLRISDVMHSGDAIPCVPANISLHEAVIVMTEKKLGMTCVVDHNKHLLGIFTDGDLRRAFDQHIDLRQTTIHQLMTTSCKTATPNMLAAQALHLMEQYKISVLVVVDDDNLIQGILHMHDLLRAGVI